MTIPSGASGSTPVFGPGDEGSIPSSETTCAAREVQRQFELVRAREKSRVESLRADKVVPHERGEVES